MMPIGYCKVVNGIVERIALASDTPEPEFTSDPSWVPDDGTAYIGGTWDGVSFSQPTQGYYDAKHDTEADEAAEKFTNGDPQLKALALVIADLVEVAFNVDQATARQQVKTRFRDYYRSLLG